VRFRKPLRRQTPGSTLGPTPVAVLSKRRFLQTLCTKFSLPKPQNPRKNVWASWREKFEEIEWKTQCSQTADFKERFKIDPVVIRILTDLAAQKQSGPLGTRYDIGDLMLMAIDRLRGRTNVELSELYGGRREAIRKGLKIAHKIAALFDFVYGLNVPSVSEATKISESLEAAGVPSPHAIYVGDCTDLPIWTQDGQYYTYKRCCPSTHAIRVRFLHTVLKRGSNEVIPSETRVFEPYEGLCKNGETNSRCLMT
jgi:hypothetical protein